MGCWRLSPTSPPGRCHPAGPRRTRGGRACRLPGHGVRAHFAAGSALAVSNRALVIVGSSGGDLLARFPIGRALWWVPPTPMEPASGTLARNQYGGWDLHALTAGAFNALLADAGTPAPRPLAVHMAMCVHAWSEGGQAVLLLGNVAGPAFGDTRWPRTVELQGQGFELPPNGMRLDRLPATR